MASAFEDLYFFQWRLSPVYILCIYILSYVFDRRWRRGGAIWPWFQRLRIWRYIRRYFKASISVEEPLNPKQLYIFCAFPHGACTISHFLTMTDACGMLSKVYAAPRRDLAASVLFWIPFVKEILMYLGNVDASASTAKYNLKRGRSLLIFIGGEKEQLLTAPRENKVVVLSRKGFLKLAHQYGAHLVPMYTYGENECFNVSKAFLGFRLWLQKNFQLGIPIAWGVYGTPIPLRTTMTVEIGKPIPVEKVQDGAEITSQMIDTLQVEFISELRRLFDRTKEKHGYSSNDQLQVL